METQKFELIDAFATWCGPCKMIEPILKDFSVKNPDITITKIDVDDNIEWARNNKINSVPTLIILKDGEEVWRNIGIKTSTQLTEIINKLKKE